MDLFVTPPKAFNNIDRWRQRISELLNQSAYGGFEKHPGPKMTAASVTVPTGTITSGTVADTYTKNQVYLTVQEENGGGTGERFDIQFSFTGLVNPPEIMSFLGYYEGNTGHGVFLYIWDFVGSAWDRVTVAGTDFPSTSAEYSLTFNLPTDAKYISAGEVRLRIYHSSAPNKTHFMYVDYISIEEPTYYVVTAGSYTDVTNITAYPNKGVTINEATGEITILQTGNYELSVTSCFAGDIASYELGLFINDSEVKDLWDRDITALGVIGSSSGRYNAKLEAGDVIKLAFTADKDDAHISLYDLTLNITQKQI